MNIWVHIFSYSYVLWVSKVRGAGKMYLGHGYEQKYAF